VQNPQPPVLTESAEQPHQYTDDQADDECQQSIDNDDVMMLMSLHLP
jgi:hypothetical protein